MLPDIPKWPCGISFISVSIAVIRETAKILAITPEIVATMAIPTVK